jgi:hypothetical protein
MSTLVAGVQEAAGHPSGPQIADTGLAINTTLTASAGHQSSGQWSFRKQRTVNPLMVPARYNFLYCSFKAGPAGSRQWLAGARDADIASMTGLCDPWPVARHPW